MSEYEQKNHMRLIQSVGLANSMKIVYLPDHPIIRETRITSRLRVVFNASSLTSNNTSLHSHLHIMRWRQYWYVYLADVQTTFRQILIDLRDLDYLSTLWKSSEEILVAYQLLSVTYGTACVPYKHKRALEIPLNEDVQLKVLGLWWDTVLDAFHVKVSSDLIQIPTKRIVLSVIAKLYHPFGWLAPMIVAAKLLLHGPAWLANNSATWQEKCPALSPEIDVEQKIQISVHANNV